MYGLLSGELILHNIETGEKIGFRGNNLELGGISPDGEYAFFKDHDTSTVYSFADRTIFKRIINKYGYIIYVPENAAYYLYYVKYNYLNLNIKSSICKGYFENNIVDTLFTMPDSISFGRMTDFKKLFSLISCPYSVATPLFCNLDSLLQKKIIIKYTSDRMSNLYVDPTTCDICLSTGIYISYDVGAQVHIGNINNTYTDTSFLSSHTEE